MSSSRSPRRVAAVMSGLLCLAIVLIFLAYPRGGDKTPGEPSLPKPSGELTSSKPGESSKSGPGPIQFKETTKTSGVDFVQVSGMTPERHFPTANGSGVAIFDYDNDGKMDLYFATGNPLPLGKDSKASNRLYKNLGGGKYQDVTESSGLGFRGYCHGIVVGDVDNDGDQDVVLCNLGSNRFYVNNGDGTFRDTSSSSGIDAPNWSSGGAFLDYDKDGDLDLYISVYGLWDIKTDGERWCGDDSVDKKSKIRQYCAPGTIRTSVHMLYRNDGLVNGSPHFTDVTKEAGILRENKGGHGFGVVTTDLNGDGNIDIYVANDKTPSFVFLNKGGGKFEDATETSGAAFDENGNPESGMGADAGDLDDDGLPELIRTNFRLETTSVYYNLGNGQFRENSSYIGVARPSKPWVKWGCGLIDFDNDGYLDIFVTNGHVDDNLHLVGKDDQPYEEPPLLWHNVKATKGPKDARNFEPVADGAGPYFRTGHVGRGSATGDLDDDGRPDLVVNHKDSPPAILMNRSQPSGRWIRLNLEGTRSNRDAVGAKVEVVANGRTIYRQKQGGGSMLSAHDPRLLIGVGNASHVKITVRWPSGVTTVLDNQETDREIKIREPETPAAGSTN